MERKDYQRPLKKTKPSRLGRETNEHRDQTLAEREGRYRMKWIIIIKITQQSEGDLGLEM